MSVHFINLFRDELQFSGPKLAKMFVTGCIGLFKRLLLSRGAAKGVLISERHVSTAKHLGGQPNYSCCFFVFCRPKIFVTFFLMFTLILGG